MNGRMLLLAILAFSVGTARARAAEPGKLPEPNGHPPVTEIRVPELEAPVAHVAEHEKAVESGFYGTAEYLLMRPRQRGLTYALVDPVDDLTPQGRLRSVRNDLRSGLSVGLGYRFEKSGWDVAFLYTTIHSRGGDQVNAPAGGVLYPQMTRPGLTDSAQVAIADSRINYNVYDLEFGKLIHNDEHTQIRLFTGIRVASIDQTVSAGYNGGLADAAFAESSSNFNGAGPMLGAEMRWKMLNNLSMFGKAQGGLIYGRTRSSLVETNNGGATLYSDVNEVFRPVVPMVGLAIGGTYTYRGLSFSAGYQVVNWFGLIQRVTLIDDFSEGRAIEQTEDLSLEGVFFRLGFQF